MSNPSINKFILYFTPSIIISFFLFDDIIDTVLLLAITGCLTFVVVYYEDVFRPNRWSKQTMKLLRGFTKYGYVFDNGRYTGEWNEIPIELMYFRTEQDKLPAIAIGVNTKLDMDGEYPIVGDSVSKDKFVVLFEIPDMRSVEVDLKQKLEAVTSGINSKE